jgi:D-tyrosyl-tRNA(Tyr) deacylase
MRVVAQTVSRASVTVAGEVVASIDAGLLILVGVAHDDTAETAAALAGKVYRLRLFDGERSAAELALPVLVISQFTLYADLRRGRRPSWSAAAPAPVARPLVTAFAEALRQLGAAVHTGVFGERMLVESVNVGPQTIVLAAGADPWAMA